jgi:uncharacterized protein (DUF1330 family)
MPVYLISEVTILDQELYAEYAGRVPALVERYGGRYLVRGGEVTPVAGGWLPVRIVLVQFETIDQVQDFLACPDYQDIVSLRQRASTSRTIIVEGYDYDL